MADDTQALGILGQLPSALMHIMAAVAGRQPYAGGGIDVTGVPCLQLTQLKVSGVPLGGVGG